MSRFYFWVLIIVWIVLTIFSSLVIISSCVINFDLKGLLEEDYQLGCLFLRQILAKKLLLLLQQILLLSISGKKLFFLSNIMLISYYLFDFLAMRCNDLVYCYSCFLCCFCRSFLGSVLLNAMGLVWRCGSRSCWCSVRDGLCFW